MSSATQITQKEPKETTKDRGISLTIMGQRSIYTSIHLLQRSLNEMLGFNQDDHPYRMCNETGIPEFLELQIPGIPMVMMATSRARSLHVPTQQDFINRRTLPIYKCHTRFIILKNPTEYTMPYSVQLGRNTTNESHAHLLGNA